MKLYKLTGLQNLDLPLQIHFRFWLFQVRRRENDLTKSYLVTFKKRGGEGTYRKGLLLQDNLGRPEENPGDLF